MGENNHSTGADIREYVWMEGMLLAQIDSSGNIVYVHSNQINAPQKITNPSRTVVWDYEIEPFGETYATPTNTTPTNHRFPGQYADAENLLSYNNNRDYDATLGRYIEADPLGFGGGPNLFSYARQTPVQSVDPWGLAPAALADPLFWPEEVALTGYAVDGAEVVGGYAFEGINATVSEVRTLLAEAETEGAGGAAADLPPTASAEEAEEFCQSNSTLYRGVSSSSPNPGQYENALSGTAEPLGGDANAEEHLMGNNNSPYTSWTDDPNEAYSYATNNRQTSGVILTKTVQSRSVIFPTSGGLHIMRSTEVLLEGPITGAIITLVP